MVLDCIKNRKSVRRYIDKEVSNEDVLTLIKAGMCAPSAHNRQPWEFIVVNDRLVLDEIASRHKHGKMLTEVNKAIVVLGNREVTNVDEFIYCDCSAVVENMLIQATSMGLGTCWCAIAPNAERVEAIGGYLELPSNIIPVAIVAVGYHEDTRDALEKFDESKIYFNQYK